MVANKSKYALIFCYTVIILTAFLYFPRWEASKTHATLTWDTAGYYMYLPTIFIYKDIKKCSFVDSLMIKYQFATNFDRSIKHPSGNHIFQYSCGQAIQFLPFFAIAHFWANHSNQYLADGFSYPYQFLIGMSSLLFAFIGLIFLRKILLVYFEDWIVSVVLVAIVMGSNYLVYTAISGAMTHNNLFAIYAIVIYTSIKYYDHPSLFKAIVLGGFIGLAALTRPTEILLILIPIFWGVNILSNGALKERLLFLLKNKTHFIGAGIVLLMIGSIQFVYWKYVTGDWIVYSYGDQGFSWLRPHLFDGFFSYKSGWITYSPIMIFALLGMVPLFRNKGYIGSIIIIYFLIFVYIAFAWDIWWYGGSVGQRTMVQIYPLLAFPLASFVDYMSRYNRLKQVLFYILFFIFIYANLWFTHQSHHGKLYRVSQMTKSYYWKVLGTYDFVRNDLKLLDTDEIYEGVRKDVKILYFNNFEADTILGNCSLESIEGVNSICLNENNQVSASYETNIQSNEFDWLRVSADFRCQHKEWTFWKMTNFIVQYYNDDQLIKKRMIRVFRLLDYNSTKNIYIDVSCPKKPVNKIVVVFDHAGGNRELVVDNLKMEVYNEN